MFIESAFAETDAIEVQEVVVADSAQPASPSLIESLGSSGIVPMILIFFVFYFLLIRPQEKKRRLQEQLVSGVKKGEEILTNTGLFGTVTQINDSDNTVMVQIAKGVEIKMLKNTISDILSRREKGEKKEQKAAISKEKNKAPKK
jgi:preprotein translocase subunit YajC